jgi:hypothetical protein
MNKYVLIISLIILAIVLFLYYNNNIEFLSAEEGRKIFNENELWYYMTDFELINRIKNNGKNRMELLKQAKEKYIEAISDFTDDEKILLLALSDGRSDKLRFIKINNIDNGWPYTIDDCIVLPEKILKDLKTTNRERFQEILTHEMFHIKQRKNQKDFNKQYVAAGLSKVSLYNIETKTPLLFNPDDEINVKWVIYIADDLCILPTLCINKSGAPIQKVILLKVHNDGKYSETDSWSFDDCPYKNKIYSVYKKLLPDITNKQLDNMGNNRHSPNEIIASFEELNLLEKASPKERF